MQESWHLNLPRPQIRTIEEMRCVLSDPSCTADQPLYFMYRDLAQSEADHKWLQDHHLRFDITIIPPGLLNGEYVKTKGHYHPESPAGVGYPELYQVFSGEAHYLLQHKSLGDIAVVKAHAGDIVLVPPDYGHVTINPGSQDLFMANIVSTAFSSEYELYERLQGAAYYEYEGGTWVKNPRYPAIPPLRFLSPPLFPEFCIESSTFIYDMVGREECCAFFNFPERFIENLNWM
jgi:glucose-6-phosphate isomerase